MHIVKIQWWAPWKARHSEITLRLQAHHPRTPSSTSHYSQLNIPLLPAQQHITPSSTSQWFPSTQQYRGRYSSGTNQELHHHFYILHKFTLPKPVLNFNWEKMAVMSARPKQRSPLRLQARSQTAAHHHAPPWPDLGWPQGTACIQYACLYWTALQVCWGHLGNG